MLKIEKTTVYGFEEAIRGMRTPMESHDKSDTVYGYVELCDGFSVIPSCAIGKNDKELMCKLAKAGAEHSKYRRMIVVYCDITAPLYWWKEFDTYKIGTVANSYSTMHKIQAHEFTKDMFSHEHLLEISDPGGQTVNIECLIRDPSNENDLILAKLVTSPMDLLRITTEVLETFRVRYLRSLEKVRENRSNEEYDEIKKYWWQMIQLLPSSYNQTRTIMTNYEVLAAIWKQRKAHKQDEWRLTFIDWIKSLPHSWIITGEENE